MRDLLGSNKEFRDAIIEGIKSGKVAGFSENLWSRVENQNIVGINSFLDVFKEGANLGYCTVAAKQLSYSLPNGCLIAGGVVEYLKGTENSEDGSHTWIVWDKKIYDTTFMMIIDYDFSKKLKYIQENIIDPLKDKYYVERKVFTNDKNLGSNPKKI